MIVSKRKKLILLWFLLGLLSKSGMAQQNNYVVQFRNMQPDTIFENVLSRKVYSDSLVSTFLIWIRKSVPLHYHAHHSEQVLILEGEAEMWVGGKKSVVGPGDWVLLPKGTPHSVKVLSADPLKVLSIQAPHFNGTDRIKLE